jgi:transposase
LAVDLGKFNSVLCRYGPGTRSAAFRTARTTPDDLRREFARQPVGRVVFEACSQAGWVHDLCEALRLPAVVASTAGDAWRWNRVKRKTGRDDALKLARLAAVTHVALNECGPGLRMRSLRPGPRPTP